MIAVAEHEQQTGAPDPTARYKDRPTLAEIMQATGSSAFACKKCGCRDLRVQTTRPSIGVVVRHRVCRNCGTHKKTFETE